VTRGQDAAWQPSEGDAEFFDVYGDWDPLTPAEVAVLMEGFPRPWWIVGGYALEAFTGVPRRHEDVDLSILTSDFPKLRAQLGGTFHLWSNTGGTFRFIDDEHPEPDHPRSQIWMRENARSPWRVDCPLNPEVGGRWQSKRDESHVAEVEEVTWIADDGIRYLNPEVALLFKATQAREKDLVDLGNAWPLMSDRQRAWLQEAVRRLYPGHAWLERLV
jgi:hypothetical protein